MSSVVSRRGQQWLLEILNWRNCWNIFRGSGITNLIWGGSAQILSSAAVSDTVCPQKTFWIYFQSRYIFYLIYTDGGGEDAQQPRPRAVWAGRQDRMPLPLLSTISNKRRAALTRHTNDPGHCCINLVWDHWPPITLPRMNIYPPSSQG